MNSTALSNCDYMALCTRYCSPSTEQCRGERTPYTTQGRCKRRPLPCPWMTYEQQWFCLARNIEFLCPLSYRLIHPCPLNHLPALISILPWPLYQINLSLSQVSLCFLIFSCSPISRFLRALYQFPLAVVFPLWVSSCPSNSPAQRPGNYFYCVRHVISKAFEFGTKLLFPKYSTVKPLNWRLHVKRFS